MNSYVHEFIHACELVGCTKVSDVCDVYLESATAPDQADPGQGG